MSVQTVSPAEVSEAAKSGEAPEIIDVRSLAEFSEIHADGAQLIPLDRLNPREVFAGRVGPSDAPLYLICKSGGRAAKACEKFAAEGFGNVFSIEGGTAAWEKAGLPVMRGRKTISLERQVRIAAGLLVLLGVSLGWFLHPLFLLLSAFVGGGLVFAGVTDWCGMGLLLARMPWNQRGNDGDAACLR